MAGFLAPLIPLAGKALFWGGSAAGAATGGYSLSQIPKNMRKDIVGEGPDAQSGKFELNPLQKMFVDEDSLMDSYHLQQMNKTKKDSRVQQALSLDPTFQVLNGQTAEDFLSSNRTGIKKAQLNERITDQKSLDTAAFNNPQNVAIRERQDRIERGQNADRNLTRDISLLQNKTSMGQQSLQRQMNTQSNNTQLQIAQMDNSLADKRMEFDRETRRIDKRQAAIATLMSGLGSLGGAFAL